MKISKKVREEAAIICAIHASQGKEDYDYETQKAGCTSSTTLTCLPTATTWTGKA